MRYLVKDTGGFSVCVQPTGAKSFQLRYSIHGRQKTLTFGNIPVKDVRASAQAARVAINEGDSPQTTALLRKTIEKSSRLYALYVKILEGCDPEAYTDSEKLLPVDEVLRQRKLRRGEFAKVRERQQTQETCSSHQILWLRKLPLGPL